MLYRLNTVCFLFVHKERIFIFFIEVKTVFFYGVLNTDRVKIHRIKDFTLFINGKKEIYYLYLQVDNSIKIMRVLIQRVSEASVTINCKTVSSINKGLLVLLGIEDADNAEDIKWLVGKIVNLRVFDDENGVMNCSVLDVDGEILLVSQFTLHASTKKGNRPSYIKAAKPEVAIPLYEQFIAELSKALNKEIQTGNFGADMKVALINDGPVTIWIDSKIKE